MRSRRRAEKLIAQAWKATDAGQLHLAEKLSRRARDEGAVNPRIWNDHGQIMSACGHLKEAEQAFRMAISLAPTYAEAAEHLARLRGDQAEALDPQPPQSPPGHLQPAPPFTALTRGQDWTDIEGELMKRGCALLPQLLNHDECQMLLALHGDEDIFEQEMTHDDESGRGTVRFFTRPLPQLVQRLRAEVYGRTAPIANQWQRLLDRDRLFPLALDDFLEQCNRDSQHRTSPLLALYEVGGFNGLHRDTESRVIFPLELMVSLGPGGSDDGGELILADKRPGKKVRETWVPTNIGDGVLFCTRERLERIAGVHGLQPVVNGLATVHNMQRYILDIPFHHHG